MGDHFQSGVAFFWQREYVKACEEYEQATKRHWFAKGSSLKWSQSKE
jgi:hypothetical protein